MYCFPLYSYAHLFLCLVDFGVTLYGELVCYMCLVFFHSFHFFACSAGYLLLLLGYFSLNTQITESHTHTSAAFSVLETEKRVYTHIHRNLLRIKCFCCFVLFGSGTLSFRIRYNMSKVLKAALKDSYFIPFQLPILFCHIIAASLFFIVILTYGFACAFLMFESKAFKLKMNEIFNIYFTLSNWKLFLVFSLEEKNQLRRDLVSVALSIIIY